MRHAACILPMFNCEVTLAAFHGKLSLLLAWTDAEALDVDFMPWRLLQFRDDSCRLLRI